jgi:hypothetical protein
MCDTERSQLQASGTIAVIDQTQPIFDLAGLAQIDGIEMTPDTARNVQQLEWRARDRFTPESIRVPSCACSYRLMPRQQQYRDVIQVEMSGVVEDPFTHSRGVFVRSSAGGRPGATWMWVTLAPSSTDGWVVKNLTVLPTQDG